MEGNRKQLKQWDRNGKKLEAAEALGCEREIVQE